MADNNITQNITQEQLQALLGAYFQRVREVEALLKDIENHRRWRMLVSYAPKLEKTVALVRKGTARAYEVQSRVAEGDLSHDDLETLPSLLEMGRHQLAKSRDVCAAIHAMLEGRFEAPAPTSLN